MLTARNKAELFYDGGLFHIETNPLICRANQRTGFYMIEISFMKELTYFYWLTHYSPVLFFYTPWKYRYIRGYRKATPGCNRLTISDKKISLLSSSHSSSPESSYVNMKKYPGLINIYIYTNCECLLYQCHTYINKSRGDFLQISNISILTWRMPERNRFS